MVMADKKEASIQNTITYPMEPNICPDIPCRNTSGRKTTQVVTVEPRMDCSTMFVPPDREALAYPRRPLSSLCLDGPETALQHHDGVIHHHAHAQHQTAHGNDVQRETGAGHQNQGHQDRGRYGASYNQGRLIVPKENEYDNHGNHGCQHQGEGHILKGAENAVRAVPDNPDIQVLVVRLPGFR